MIKKLLFMFLRLIPRVRLVDNQFKQGMGITKSPKDNRDDLFVQQVKSVVSTGIDLSKYCLPVKSQGRIGSCGSHVFATMLEMEHRIKNTGFDLPLSEKDHYWMVRQRRYENTFPKDSGQFLRNGAKALLKEGISPESLCPYIVSKYNDKPSKLARSFGKRWFKIKSFHSCKGVKHIKSALSGGHPVALAMPIDQNFQSKRNSAPVTSFNNRKKVGGHALTIVGYDDSKQAFKCVNSWGKWWGNKGFVWLSYSYVNRYTWEAWSIRI